MALKEFVLPTYNTVFSFSVPTENVSEEEIRLVLKARRKLYENKLPGLCVQDYYDHPRSLVVASKIGPIDFEYLLDFLSGSKLFIGVKFPWVEEAEVNGQRVILDSGFVEVIKSQSIDAETREFKGENIFASCSPMDSKRSLGCMSPIDLGYNFQQIEVDVEVTDECGPEII